MAGSYNDINVLSNSPLFDDLIHGRSESVQFDINNRSYSQGYYLTDGIYPQWPVFVRPLTSCVTDEQKHFNVIQAALRKDIECTFGILQARFHILARPSRLWSVSKMADVMKACVILHNMIICDETPRRRLQDSQDFADPEISPFSFRPDRNPLFNQLLQNSTRNTDDHRTLRDDLIQHLASLKD
jgi:hypothetical protein